MKLMKIQEDGSTKFDKNINFLKDMTFKINEVLHEYKDL
jgi:hypothetical protein